MKTCEGKMLHFKCEVLRCHGTLCKIGRARKNGKKRHADWVKRRYHKDCFKQLMEEKELEGQRKIDDYFFKLISLVN
jgi:hypothetical protein